MWTPQRNHGAFPDPLSEICTQTLVTMQPISRRFTQANKAAYKSETASSIGQLHQGHPEIHNILWNSTWIKVSSARPKQASCAILFCRQPKQFNTHSLQWMTTIHPRTKSSSWGRGSVANGSSQGFFDISNKITKNLKIFGEIDIIKYYHLTFLS
jgi:hypothetical protein